VTSKPQLWVFSGPNGAGKSTLAAKYIAGRIPIVNPDVIALDIAPGNFDPSVMLRAGRLAIEERRNFLAAGATFAMETTLTGQGELRFMQAAREQNYKVNLVFVGLARAEDSYSRVMGRVQAGGHPVPDADIARRFARSMANLPAAMRIAHRSYVVDNSGEGFRLMLVRMARETRYIRQRLPAWTRAAVPAALRQTPEMGMEL
jgi:predicted ABC-type ATPase|tara:strand:+ start:24706 stop:25314 length:609 start_codon:yes stop_codon:yes gene_type:complete